MLKTPQPLAGSFACPHFLDPRSEVSRLLVVPEGSPISREIKDILAPPFFGRGVNRTFNSSTNAISSSPHQSQIPTKSTHPSVSSSIVLGQELKEVAK